MWKTVLYAKKKKKKKKKLMGYLKYFTYHWAKKAVCEKIYVNCHRTIRSIAPEEVPCGSKANISGHS